MKPHILHILGTAELEGSGIVRIVRGLATRLSDRYRFSAWFILQDGPLRAELESAGVATRFVHWWPSPKDPLGAARFWNSLRHARVDLLDQHFGGPRVRWIARRAGSFPVVLHVHGRVAEDDEPRPFAQPTHNADAVIANSNAVAAFAANAEVIYPGVDVPPDPAPLQPDGELVIGTAGRLIALKRIDDLLESVAQLVGEFPRLRLEIAGRGPELGRLQDEARQRKIADRVRFLGWQPLPATMRSWQVYVHAADEEAFGMSILEAMAAGLPVVATRVGGATELVEDGESGCTVEPRQPALLAAGIAFLLRDADARRRMGNRGRQIARERFSSERMARQTDEVYRRLLGSIGDR